MAWLSHPAQSLQELIFYFFFPCTTTGSSVLGFLTLSICWPAWVQKQGTGAEYTRINAARPSIKGFLHLRKSLFQFNSEPHAFMSDSLASNPVCCSLLMILISIYRTVNIGEARYKSSLFLCIQSWSICLQAFFFAALILNSAVTQTPPPLKDAVGCCHPPSPCCHGNH